MSFQLGPFSILLGPGLFLRAFGREVYAVRRPHEAPFWSAWRTPGPRGAYNVQLGHVELMSGRA